MATDSISELCRFLDSIQTPWALLGNPDIGRALVVEEGARVMAISAPGSERNSLWNHPDLMKCGSREEVTHMKAGGLGGLRLWQAPEGAYMWQGLAEPKTFSNYQVQREMDPGAYSIEQSSPNRCVVAGKVGLEPLNGGTRVEFEIRRIIELIPLPDTGHAEATGLKLRFQNYLHLKTGDETSHVDLWHLMQLPPGTVVGARVARDAQPLIYFNPDQADDWTVQHNRFTWRTNGKRMAKMGFGSEVVTGGLFAIRKAGAATGIHVWNAPIWRGTEYVDSPPGTTRTDQAAQFWDGFDFCEAEYHSPGASMARPEIFDTSELIYVESMSKTCEPYRIVDSLLPQT